ncbi:MAG: glycosyltransferase [Candidatus Eisenbacteria bacterium]|nr:glycosyltransferase [Candidatus Eisenbacteria bacterium]
MRVWSRVSGLEPGGSEQVAGALAAEAVRAGHEVTLSLRPAAALDAWAAGMRAGGVGVERLAEAESKWDWGGMIRTRAAMAVCRPHLVHLHLVHPTADRYAPFLAPRAAAVIATEHVRHEVPERSQLWLKRAGARRLARVVAVSEAVRRSLVEHYGLAESRVTVIRNGVDLARFAPGGDRARARAALGLPALGFVVGSAGRLTRQKGFDLLLAACARMEGAFVLAVAGDGEDAAALRRLAGELGLAGRVRWLGRVERMEDFYAAIDVFALASRWEGLPITLLEALASGVPSVATAVDGTLEVLAAGGGSAVPPESAEALGAALDLWRHSDNLREQAAGDAARVGRLFDWRNTWAAYAALYEEVTAWKRTVSPRW